MEWYDMLMLAVLAVTTLFGFAKGMAWQVASLASIVVSYLVALRFSESLVATGIVGDEAPWNRFVAMLVIYVATSLAIWLAFRFVSNAINRVRLQEFDRQIGGLFGLAKGVLLCVAITFFALTLATRSRDAVLRSRSGHYIALLIARADSVMPREVHEVLDPYLDRIEEELGGRDDASAASDSGALPASARPADEPDGGGGPLLLDASGRTAGEGEKVGDVPLRQSRRDEAVGTRLR
jgi:membrane protein required for colicin V production